VTYNKQLLEGGTTFINNVSFIGRQMPFSKNSYNGIIAFFDGPTG